MSSQRHLALTSVALGVGAVAVTAALAVGAGALVRAYVPDDEGEATEEPDEVVEAPPTVEPLDASAVATVDDAAVDDAAVVDAAVAPRAPQVVAERLRPPPRRRPRVRTRAS